MKKFTAYCVDEQTRMEVLLSECSYNMACFYLDNNYFNTIDFESIGGRVKVKYDMRTDRYLIFAIDKKENIVGRVFCYDEIRGLLLGD